jgi:branched-chain amino acid transport system ATP-binding protein
MLSVSALEAGYGRSRVLFDVSLEVGEGEVVTLLGRNGMGKTTTVRAIMGLTPPRGGRIEFRGRSIAGATPEAVARSGIGLVPEGRQVFPTLSVRENLIATAANRQRRANPWTLPRIFALFPRLAERQDQRGGTLSGGEQQMLAIARALLTNPALLILDEATEGLAPNLRGEIWACLAALRAEGQSILMIDKTIRVLKRLADRHYIIEKGRTVWTGSSAELDRAPELLRQHLGV